MVAWMTLGSCRSEGEFAGLGLADLFGGIEEFEGDEAAG